jgi:hypothetical protein
MANGDGDNERLGGLTRIAELLLRLKIHEMKGERNQTEMICLLDSLSFKSGEIIQFLGASAASVRPILSRGRKKTKNKSKVRRNGGQER